MGDLTETAKQNLKYIEDIKKYNDVHANDFSQVFFKPNAGNIKSSQVGVYSKDIFGNEQVTPVKTVAGYHTKDSCELNTAIYANSLINYNSPTNYKPGVNTIKVDGDFANSPNYFLNAVKITSEPTTNQIVSVEISGYIAAQNPGNYKVSNQITIFPKNVLIWVGNNALKTYRKENAVFRVENGVTKQNISTQMVVGEYTPFRIQYSYGMDYTQLDYTKLWVNEDQYPISVFATNVNENTLYYYSLTPSDQSNYYKCDIYSGSDLQKYKTDTKQQVKIVWQKDILEETAFIFLDMIGNLCVYDSNYEKIGQPLFQMQDPNARKTKTARYKLKLYQRNLKPLCIKDNNDVVTPLITIDNLDTVKNEEWEKTPNPMKKTMTNKEEQIGEKRISEDRISESNPLFSENFRYKLCIMRNAQNKKILALLASTTDPRQFYTTEPDLKMNKLFYASTYIENKFLREVPKELQTPTTTYSTYSNTYPLNSNNYTSTKFSNANTCKKQCNDSPGCNYFYKTIDSTGTNCLLNNNNSEPATYLPQQPGSKYTSSFLKIKNNVIKTNDAEKQKVYDSAPFVLNGYEDNVHLGFSDYPVERNVLRESDIPGPSGTSYVVDLRNKVSKNTSVEMKPISLTNINNPMIAGKLENGKLENFTVVDDSLTKLSQIDTQLNSYKLYQSQINPNRVDISNNITSINKTYLDMSGNKTKYDFTGSIIYALEEDRSLTSALLKDNVTYMEEQNNLYVITALTVATLLITAILVSK